MILWALRTASKNNGMKSRRDESEGMEESMGKSKIAGDKAMKFQAGGRMPVGMANQRAGVTGGMRQQELIDPPTITRYARMTGSMPSTTHQRSYPCTTAASNATSPECCS
jgi:hypothetical protein